MIILDTHTIHEAIENIDRCIAFLHSQTELNDWIVLYQSRIQLMDILNRISTIDEYRLNKVIDAIEKHMSNDIGREEMIRRIEVDDPTV